MAVFNEFIVKPKYCDISICKVFDSGFCVEVRYISLLRMKFII